MRRISHTITSIAGATAVAGGLLWGTPKLLTQLELAAVPGIAVETLSAVGLNVENVTVQGRVRTRPDEILGALEAVRGTPILEIDVPLARERLTALPWVKTAEIVRQLPNSLHITLEEHAAFALWQNKGQYKLVARDGTAITQVEHPQPDMVILVGGDAPLHAASLFDSLSKQPQLTSRVKAMVRLSGRRWNVILDNVDDGVVIKLPEQNVSEAWNMLASIDAKHGLLDRAISEIDLRIAGQLVVKLIDGYAPIAPEAHLTPPARGPITDMGSAQNKELADRV